jgi:hypothetical protein
MHINELLEEKQTDEGIASAIGTGIGAVSKAAGAIPGAVHGAWDKFKQGYQAGRGGVNGTNPAPTGGGSGSSTASSGSGTTATGSNGVAQSGSGGVTTPYTRPAGGQQAAAPAPAAAKQVDPAVVQTSIQHLKGGDVERIRGMLKSKAGISESQLDEISIGGIARGAKNLATGAGQAVKGAYNAAAPVVKNAAQATGQAVKGAYNAAKPVVQKAAQATGQAIKAAPAAIGNAAGAVRGAVTTARGAYQQSKGGSMTAQELDHAIATMTPDQAKEMLQFFNSIHPEATAATPTATTPATTGTPAAEPTPQVYGSRGIAGMGESVGYSRFLKIEI